ncbi:siderophore-interacting protein [Streptantibioticus parmotrematis]|uniref:siderophore-interacting protein n=1 Tax=Streptantibioticus parmotrematis TaxID=2873249 RepID=UPI00340A3FAC
MAEAPQRRSRPVFRASVLRTERLTPHMIRVVLGGGLDGFTAGTYTDHYVKLIFPQDGTTLPEPFDLRRVREELPREQWPRTRTYTVRHWDTDAGELTVDFVHHGDEGIAGPWAANARPGDELLFSGPGGAYAPDPTAAWHLLAGDESALPAIAAAVERLPEDAVAHVFVEVADEREEQKLQAPSGVRITWLHRGARPIGEALVGAVRALPFPAGTPQVFVHGEANFVKELRRYLRVERQIERELLSVSGYWRTGADEDGWQASKSDWNRQVESEQESGAAS